MSTSYFAGMSFVFPFFCVFLQSLKILGPYYSKCVAIVSCLEHGKFLEVGAGCGERGYREESQEMP